MKGRINILSLLSVVLLFTILIINRFDSNMLHSELNTPSPKKGILKTDNSNETLTETSLSLIPIEELENLWEENELLSLKKAYVFQEGQQKALPKEHQIENFDIILQLPELPTGCEITSMTMALNYYGLNADKVTMATKYLPTMPANLYYGKDGKLYGEI